MAAQIHCLENPQTGLAVCVNILCVCVHIYIYAVTQCAAYSEENLFLKRDCMQCHLLLLN